MSEFVVVIGSEVVPKGRVWPRMRVVALSKGLATCTWTDGKQRPQKEKYAVEALDTPPPVEGPMQP